MAPDPRRMLAALREDVTSAMMRDPALRSTTDALLNAPGLHAIWSHRVAHAMWEQGGVMQTPARVLSTIARAVTGIEIHPAARIGRRCFIDHGMGVVIGETAVVGNDVLLYHGATLGGRDAGPGKRHPTVGDDARIGANAVVVKDVPSGATAVGVAATVRGATDTP